MDLITYDIFILTSYNRSHSVISRITVSGCNKWYIKQMCIIYQCHDSCFYDMELFVSRFTDIEYVTGHEICNDMLPVVRWSLQWRHDGRDSVSTHQPHDCLLNRLFRRRSKKTSKLRVTGLCAGNSPVTGEFPEQMASNAETVSIWLRRHVIKYRQ